MIGWGRPNQRGITINRSLFALSSAMIMVCAQVAPAPATTPVMQVGVAPDSMLRTGTEVSLKLSEPLTTKGKNLRVG